MQRLVYSIELYRKLGWAGTRCRSELYLVLAIVTVFDFSGGYLPSQVSDIFRE